MDTIELFYILRLKTSQLLGIQNFAIIDMKELKYSDTAKLRMFYITLYYEYLFNDAVLEKLTKSWGRKYSGSFNLFQ